MMTVHKIAAADAVGYADYLSAHQVSRAGDYYLGRDGARDRAPGEWHGAAARALGLPTEVDRDAMLRVWEGRDPNSGDVVIRRGSTGEHVAGIDCTFSAPKSVSVVWALSGPDDRQAVEAAQARAVAVALDHIERHARLVRRRVDGAIQHEAAAGIAVSRFRHHTSRLATEQERQGLAPDPQLHDHCVVANLALRREAAADAHGTWGAIDSRELFRIAGEAGAVFRAELAWDLQRLGFSVEREGKAFEVRGVPAAVRDEFSRRREEVDAAKVEFVGIHGRQPTDIETRDLIIRSRRAKQGDEHLAFEQWEQRAAALGFSLAQVERSEPCRDGAPTFERVLAMVLDELCDPEAGLTRSHAVIDRRTLTYAAAVAAQGLLPGHDIDRLLAAVTASPYIVWLDEQHCTTRAHLAIEGLVIGRALAGANTRGRALSPWTVQQSIANARVPLTAEQQDAVARLTDGRRFRLMAAPAGAGKGEVLRSATQAWQQEERRVIAVAAAGETAQRLGEECGTDDARTVDWLVRAADSGALVLTKGDVILVDEAALLETRRWDAVLRVANDATVIAAGDPAQLSSIEAGGMWSVLAQRVGTVQLAENHRAHEAWMRDAWSDLRAGATLEAIRAHEERGLVSVSETRDAARQAAVQRWDAERCEGKKRGRAIEQFLLVSDGSNHDVDAMNTLAQQRRIDAGELGAQSVQVSPVDHARRSRMEAIRPGDLVTFERKVYPRHGGSAGGERRNGHGPGH